MLCNKNDSSTPVDSSDSRHYNRSMAKFVEEQERKKYDINIMAVKDDGKVSMAISADTCFKEDVTLLVLGEYKAIKKCFCI